MCVTTQYTDVMVRNSHNLFILPFKKELFFEREEKQNNYRDLIKKCLVLYSLIHEFDILRRLGFSHVVLEKTIFSVTTMGGVWIIHNQFVS